LTLEYPQENSIAANTKLVETQNFHYENFVETLNYDAENLIKHK
jgi:hypothetical protein